MAQDGLTIVSAINSTLEFSTDGGTTWRELPFAGDIEASGGEAPTSEIATFKRVGTTVGHDRVPSLEVTVPSYIPNHSSWRNLVTEGKAGNPVNVRITTRERLLATSGMGNTAAITAAGLVTLSPTVIASPGHSIDWRSDLYGVGLGIKYPAAVYTVDTISAVGVLTVDPAPAAAVAAAVYSAVGPSLRLGPILARIVGLASFSMPAEGALNKSVTIQPLGQLPDWSVNV